MLKKTLILLVVGLMTSISAMAQNFTGTIVYDFKVTGPMADQVKGMMQEKQIVKIKGNNMRQTLKGGMMATMMGDIVFLGDKKEAYILQPNEKKALKLDLNEQEETKEKPKVTKLSEVVDIAGYKCTKYSIETENPQLGTVTEYVWATKDIKIVDDAKKVSKSSISKDGVDGVILKMVTEMNGMFTLTMVATSVSKAEIADSEFVIPKDYKVEKFDPSMFGGK